MKTTITPIGSQFFNQMSGLTHCDPTKFEKDFEDIFGDVKPAEENETESNEEEVS
jgi:hypothetical protein